MDEKDAEHLSRIALKTFDEAPYLNPEKRKILSLTAEPLLVEIPSKASGNAVILCIEDEFSLKARAVQTILMRGLKEPFFSTLRTKQQTGYIVQAEQECLDDHLFNLFMVQSNTHQPQELLARFELFIETFLQELTTESLPENRFQTLKHSAIVALQHPPKNMERMGALLYHLAFEEEGNFRKRAQEIEALESLTYDEFAEHVKSVLGRQNKKRLACSVKGVIDEPFEYKVVKKLKDKREDFYEEAASLPEAPSLSKKAF